MERKNWLCFYANCVWTSGLNGALLVDLQMRRYLEVSNLVFEVFGSTLHYEIRTLKVSFPDFDEGIDLFADYFVEEDYAFYSSWEPTQHVTLANFFDSYSPVIVAQVNLPKEVDIFMNRVLEPLSNLNVENLVLYVENRTELELFLQAIDDRIFKSFMSVDLHLKDVVPTKSELDTIYKRIDSLCTIFIYGPYEKGSLAKDKILVCEESSFKNYEFSSSSLDYSIKKYMESQKHNSSLNRSVYIDADAFVFNHYSHQQSLGSALKDDLISLIFNSNIISLWNIGNDQVEICKDCSFRCFCDNPSELIKKEGKYYKLQYCSKPHNLITNKLI